MLGSIFNALGTTVSIISDVFDGKLDSRKVSRLLAEGYTVYEISQGFGVAESVIKDLIDD